MCRNTFHLQRVVCKKKILGVLKVPQYGGVVHKGEVGGEVGHATTYWCVPACNVFHCFYICNTYPTTVTKHSKCIMY